MKSKCTPKKICTVYDPTAPANSILQLLYTAFAVTHPSRTFFRLPGRRLIRRIIIPCNVMTYRAQNSTIAENNRQMQYRSSSQCHMHARQAIHTTSTQNRRTNQRHHYQSQADSDRCARGNIGSEKTHNSSRCCTTEKLLHNTVCNIGTAIRRTVRYGRTVVRTPA